VVEFPSSDVDVGLDGWGKEKKMGGLWVMSSCVYVSLYHFWSVYLAKEAFRVAYTRLAFLKCGSLGQGQGCKRGSWWNGWKVE
jgi:hypothetical protein